ncbi:MAG: Lrp/AsnC family transcriptional regulator [Kineosporiaceae bacterium]|nr:Lrp/AsnC family transcriptional regulator [Kineosporiaceae bacterium]
MPQPTEVPRLDQIDRAILRLLQQDGRLTNAELAKQVRLSPSPCLRRVKALEQAGYITGYTAVLDAAKLHRSLHVMVMVSLTSQRQETLEAFERAVSELDDVLACYLIAGEADYLLTVAVKDLDAYQQLYTRRLGELPGVASMKSLVTMKAVKASTALPL